MQRLIKNSSEKTNRQSINNLGKKIKELRVSQSKSLNSFVFEKTGLTTATWSRVENGLVDPKYTTLIKIASALNITLDQLFENIDVDYSIDE